MPDKTSATAAGGKNTRAASNHFQPAKGDASAAVVGRMTRREARYNLRFGNQMRYR